MLFETTEALANAIDAKVKYTQGHSARVAVISRLTHLKTIWIILAVWSMCPTMSSKASR